MEVGDEDRQPETAGGQPGDDRRLHLRTDEDVEAILRHQAARSADELAKPVDIQNVCAVGRIVQHRLVIAAGVDDVGIEDISVRLGEAARDLVDDSLYAGEVL